MIYSEIHPGQEVQISRNQDRLGGPKYPGRIGTVLDENQFGKPEGLWNVKLDATNRAKARVECFWSKELEKRPAPQADSNNKFKQTW